MTLRLWRAGPTEKPALALAYTAYMAEIVPNEDFGDTANYFASYWNEPARRTPYLFGEEEPFGFAFLQTVDAPELDFEITEFCVYPAFRGTGLAQKPSRCSSQNVPGIGKFPSCSPTRRAFRFGPRLCAR